MALTWEQVGQLRAQGFAEDEIRFLHGIADPATLWETMGFFIHRRTIDWGLVQANTGATPDEIRWLQALPSAAAVWQGMAAIQQRSGVGAAPAGPTLAVPNLGTNLPPIPGLPSGQVDASAKAIITGFLEQYGLGGLANWAWEQYKNGAPLEQIFLEIRKRPEYKARFPAMEALAKQGRAISEAEYIEYERSVIGIFHAAGLPKGFYDQPGDFTKFLSQNISPAELQGRVEAYLTLAYDTPGQDEFQRLYGIGPGAIAAYFIDPDRALPHLEKMARSAVLGTRSIGAGFGQLSQSEAERLAELGISPEQAAQTFGQLTGFRELFSPLDQGETAISRQTQLAAGFEQHAASQEEIMRRARRRQAPFEQGGEFAASAQGFAGVGATQP